MQHTLEIKQFYFNSATDYLPYFKNFTITIDADKNVKDLLSAIQLQNSSFSYPKVKTLARINGAVVDARISIEEIVAAFGTALKIEPASTFRATHDMKIDDKDFYANYKMLEPFCDEADLAYYKTLYAQHYASNTQLLAPEYIGDAILMLAKHLIDNDDSRRDAILNIVDTERGIWLYEHDNMLYPKSDITPIVNGLKSMLKVRKEAKSPLVQIKKRLNLTKKAPVQSPLKETTPQISKSEVSKPFTDFNIAYFAGIDASETAINDANSIIKTIGATPLSFAAQKNASGRKIMERSLKTAAKKAGDILLDAFDNSADIFVVADREELSLFDGQIKACEKATGREIDLAVITLSQLTQIAKGTTDKANLGLDQHKSPINFI